MEFESILLFRFGDKALGFAGVSGHPRIFRGPKVPTANNFHFRIPLNPTYDEVFSRNTLLILTFFLDMVLLHQNRLSKLSYQLRGERKECRML